MTYEQWSTLMSTRVQGTKNLRTLLPQAMDFFILLSSVNGLLGSVSQANYAAANTYMDAFAEYYSTPESPIISIDLGWMDFAGTVAESHAITQRIKDTKCVRPISEDQMCGLLDYYCDGDRARAATRQQISIGIQPQESSAGDAGSKRGGGYLDRPVWKHILFVASTKTRSSPEVTDPTANPTVSHTTQPEPEKRLTPAALLSRAQSLPEALHTAMQSLRWKIATDLGTPENDIDTSKPLHEAGVDSLLAVQIKSWVREEMRAEVSVFDIMGTKSVLEVCEQIAKTSKLVVVAAE
jgi:acyl carrier protein